MIFPFLFEQILCLMVVLNKTFLETETLKELIIYLHKFKTLPELQMKGNIRIEGFSLFYYRGIEDSTWHRIRRMADEEVELFFENTSIFHNSHFN